VVDCYWLLQGHGSRVPEPVVPDGRAELIFHYGTAFRRHHPDGTVESQARSLVAGQITAPVVLSCDGVAGVAGIRLRAAAAGNFLRTRADALTGCIESLDSMLDTVDVVEQLAAARDDRIRIMTLDRWMVQQHVSRPRPDLVVAVHTIQASRGTARMESVTKHSEMGARQLERVFLEHVGLTPKMFARVIRLRHAVKLLRRGRSIASVAVACGYYDQPHMTRDFRRLLDRTPRDWQHAGSEFGALFAG
jgi:AraC-like DNA-binding protein